MNLIDCMKRPTISFKDGWIGLSSRLTTALGVKIGDRVSILKDFDNPTDFYIKKSPNGIPVCKGCGNYLRVYSKAAYDMVIKETEHDNPTYRIGDAINVDGDMVYPIITRKPVNI